MTQPGGLRNMSFNQTFQSSLVQKNNEKFTIQKSLYKGIKQNDVSKIIDQNSVSAGNENKQLFDELKEVEGIVLDTRKRFDKIRSETTRTEQQISKLKSQKEHLQEDENKYLTLKEKNRKQFQSTENRLLEISALMDGTVYRKDIYTNLKDVLKHDVLVLKKRYFDKDVRLMRDNTKLKTLRTEHESKCKLSKRCKQMLESVQKSVHTKQLQRTSKIQSFCDVLSRKQTIEQNKEIRQRQIQQAMISAMTDKLSEEKEWIRMFQSNLFLKNILKAKMQRLMEKHQQIQYSFHRIKQQTSLKNSNQFIERFLSREQTYGLLLESISVKQRQLQELKQEREQLQKIHQNYVYKGQQINEEKKKHEPKKNLDNIGVQNPNNILNQFNEKVVKITRQKQLLYQWGVKFLSSFNGQPNKNQTMKKFPKAKLKQLIIQILNKVKQFLANLLAQQNHNQKIEEAFLKNNPNSSTLSYETIQKNTRVKTISTWDPQGGDSFQDKDMVYDDISEEGFIHHNRRLIKKNDLQNRKFRIKTKPN